MASRSTQRTATVSIHQKDYIEKLKFIDPKSWTQFRSLRAKLLWLTNTRPDIACAVAKATQLTAKTFTDSDAGKQLNRSMSYLKETKTQATFYPQLDRDSLVIRSYADASFADDNDGSIQLGYIIFLTDKHRACQPIAWSSHKSKRVSRSTLGSETMDFADAPEMVYIIKHGLQKITGQKIPHPGFTDSLSLFDIITRTNSSLEKRLMIDIEIVKQAC